MALFSRKSPDLANRLAERQAARESVFLQEIDDALREDDALRLFRRYALPVGVAIGVGLAALAGWMAWTNHAAAVVGERGEKLTVALDQIEAARFDTARPTLDQLAQTGGPGYQSVARLVEAAIAIEQKKPDEAAKIYAAVAADPAAPQAYRDLASLRGVAIQYDKLPPEQVVERLKPLAIPGSAWFGSAAEMVGMAYLKQGKPALAAALFGAVVKDQSVPESLRRRIGQVATGLGVDIGSAPGQAAPAP